MQTCMRSSVKHKVSTLKKRFPTIRASMRSFSGVNENVSFQLYALLEFFIAVRTFIRFIPSVNLQMNAQAFLDTKTLATHLALERTLSFEMLNYHQHQNFYNYLQSTTCVDSTIVKSQERRFGERFPTHITHMSSACSSSGASRGAHSC